MSHEKMDLYGVLWPIARKGLDHKFDRTVEGIENIPDQPAMYVPNHILFADSALVAISFTEATGTPMRFGAKLGYFEGKGVDDKGKYGRSMKWIVEHSGMYPVDRDGGNPRAFIELQRQVGNSFSRGDSAAIHGEGTRSTDGRLHKMKSGAARIAMAYSVPVVPVGIVYKDSSNSSKTHVDIRFGQPVTADEYTSGAYSLLPNKLKAELLIQTIENRVADLTDMVQTGVFAPRRKLHDLRADDEASE